MKKLVLVMVVLLSIFITACAEKESDITLNALSQNVLEAYNFEEIANSFVENEDGSIVYSITNATIATMKEEAAATLANNIENFVASIKEQNAEIVVDVDFSEDGTVLEGTVTDAAGAVNGMFFLILQSYPDIIATQVLSGIDPTGITVKMTDAVTEEIFEEILPF